MTSHTLHNEQGSGEQLTTHYLLSDAVYSEAEIPIGDTVYLWLGVSVMVVSVCLNCSVKSTVGKCDVGVSR